MSSDKIVIEIDRDLYRLCLACIAVLFLPAFFFFILPLTYVLGWHSPISILVVWPLIVVVMLYCCSRWKGEPTSDADSLRNQSDQNYEE